MFEHAIFPAVYQLMQLQTYQANSMTDTFKVVEKVFDILGQEKNSLTSGSQQQRKNGKNSHNNGYYHILSLAPSVYTKSVLATTFQDGDTMDLSTIQSGPKCY